MKLENDLEEYFSKLELEGIKLSDPQKWWYAKKREIQGDFMLREFPSTPEEAFQASQEGYWYVREINELYQCGRVKDIAYDRALPVHTAWDLGQADATSIWFFQVNRSDDINVIDFWQKSSTPLDQIKVILNAKGYNYGTHIWPHDAAARDRSGITFVDQARSLLLTGIVLEPHNLLHGINLVKSTFSKCWFDQKKCHEGLEMLQTYKKKWSPGLGGWSSEPIHDSASHASDAFRYMCAGIKRVVNGSGSLESDYAALRKFWG